MTLTSISDPETVVYSQVARNASQQFTLGEAVTLL